MGSGLPSAEPDPAFPGVPWGLGRGRVWAQLPGACTVLRAGGQHQEQALDGHPMGHYARVTDARRPSGLGLPRGDAPRAALSSVSS